MRAFLAILTLVLSFQHLVAGDAAFDVVTMETVRSFCAERKVEFSEWQNRYRDQLNQGKGVIYPRQGSIHDPASKLQQHANQISFYCEWRFKRGDALHALSEQFLVFRKEFVKTSR